MDFFSYCIGFVFGLCFENINDFISRKINKIISKKKSKDFEKKYVKNDGFWEGEEIKDDDFEK